jgi:hypothetical protein
MTNRYTSANTTTAELAADYFDQPDRICYDRAHPPASLLGKPRAATSRHPRANQGVPRPRSRPHCQAESHCRLGGTAAAWPLTKYQSVGNPADLQNRVDQLKEQGEKVAVLLVSNADAETRFVALSLQ